MSDHIIDDSRGYEEAVYRCPYCNSELVPMFDSWGCPLTQKECDRRREQSEQSEAP